MINKKTDKARKSQKLTQNRVRELLDYDPNTGKLTWRFSIAKNKIKQGTEAGCIDRANMRRLVCIDGKTYKAHRIIWLHVYGYEPECFIDHINRNPSDNRLCNLREVTNKCNIRNTGNYKNNTSSVKGIYWHKDRKKWYAHICVDGDSHHLGSYKSLDNAVCARLAAEQCFNWSGCDSNSPAFKYVKQNIIGGM